MPREAASQEHHRIVQCKTTTSPHTVRRLTMSGIHSSADIL